MRMSKGGWSLVGEVGRFRNFIGVVQEHSVRNIRFKPLVLKIRCIDHSGKHGLGEERKIPQWLGKGEDVLFSCHIVKKIL